MIDVFVDTNILVDFVCKREGFFLQAKALFAAGYIGKIKLMTSALSVVNTIYIGRKHGSTIIRERLKQLSSFVEIVDLSSSATLWALGSKWEDYEDAVQYKSAIGEKADCIVTRNKRDFVESSLQTYTAEEILDILKRQ